jgi:hypothetical protein
VFVLVSGGLAFWLSRHVRTEVSAGAWVTVSISAIAGIFVTRSIALKNRREAQRVVPREPGSVAPNDALEAPAHPYRARLWRATIPLPALSGRTTALVVGCLLLLSGVLVPVSLKLPRWVEIELVLGVWWGMLFGFLAALLHRGMRIREDHAFRLAPKLSQHRSKIPPPGSQSKKWLRLEFLDVLTFGAGCGEIWLGVVLAAAAVATAWVVVELAFPVVFFFLYWLVIRMIARIANDRHGCQGNLARSTAWGALWATLYTLPIAAVVWGVHGILVRGGHG